MLYRFARIFLGPIVKLLFRPKYINHEILEKYHNKGIVLAGNHNKNFDPVFVALSTKRTIHFIAKEALNHGLVGYFFRALQIIGVERFTHENKEAMNNAVSVLKNKEILGIFPEGTRNKTKASLLPFKHGAASMAKKAEVDIIPLAIRGRFLLFGLGKTTITFGKPITTKNKEVALITKELQDAVQKLKEL